jgi:hypothetical protein
VGTGRDRKRIKAVLAATLPVVVAASCGASDLLGPDAGQGIQGIALIGPQCPVQTLEDPCPDLPHDALVTVRNGSGVVVTRFRTGEDGRFRVGLRPGSYTLEPEGGDPFPVASDVEVDVFTGDYTEVVLLFDTGIR